MDSKFLGGNMLIILSLLALFACKKQATQKVASVAPVVPPVAGSTDGCGVDGQSLALSSQALPAIDASKLKATNLNVIDVGYAGNLVTSVAVAFDAPVARNALEYIADYGLIEVVTDAADPKVIYSKETASYSEVIPIPPSYRGKKLFIQASACVIQARRATQASCGNETVKTPIVQKPISAPNAGSDFASQINQKNLLLRVNEDKRAGLCKILSNKAKSFLASLGGDAQSQQITSDQKIIVSVAQFAANDPIAFATVCSSSLMDELYDMKQTYDQYLKENPSLKSESFGLADTCVSTDSGTVEDETLKKAKEACLVDSGSIWDAVSLACIADPKIAELELKGKTECDAKSSEGYEWDASGSFCLKTISVDSTASTKAKCDEAAGVWDEAAVTCTVEVVKAADLGFEFSLNIEAEHGQCVELRELNKSIGSQNCDPSKSKQLFHLRSDTTNDLLTIENKQAKACVEIGSVNGDSYYVTSATCDSKSVNQQFKMVKKKLDDLNSYLTFVSEKKNDAGESFCLEQSKGGDLLASVCVSKSEYLLAKNQSFLLKPLGGSALRVQKNQSFLASSIISENSGIGDQCFEAGTSYGLSLSTCKVGSSLQLFYAKSNGAVMVDMIDPSGSVEKKCLDYSKGVDTLSPLGLESCADDLLAQRFVIKKMTVLVSGAERTFNRIGLFSPQQEAGSKCLASNTGSLVFANCIEATDYESLKSQLFTVKPGGGSREPFASIASAPSDSKWYGNLAGSARKDAWKKAGISMLVIGSVFVLSAGAGTIAANVPANSGSSDLVKKQNEARKSFIREQGASGLSAESVQRLRDKNLNLSYGAGETRFLDLKEGDIIPDGIVNEADLDVVEEQGKKTLLADAKVEYKEVKPGVYDSKTGAFAELEVSQAKFAKNPTYSVNTGGNKIDLKFSAGDFKAGFSKELADIKAAQPASGKPGGRFKAARTVGLIAGVSQIVLGGLITGFDLAEGLSCNQALTKDFVGLSQADLFTKMACEIGAVEGEIATAKQAFDELEKSRDNLIFAAEKAVP